jgi:hypothetical protein
MFIQLSCPASLVKDYLCLPYVFPAGLIKEILNDIESFLSIAGSISISGTPFSHPF